jgi:ABC-type antimicrobial peptide transport system permease subunit
MNEFLLIFFFKKARISTFWSSFNQSQHLPLLLYVVVSFVCVCVFSLNVTYLLESCFIQSITLPPPPLSYTTCFLALRT